jgi:hypothetical protein
MGNIYPSGYYVYAYIRKSNNTPYYIGKGKGRRFIEKHLVQVPVDRSRIVIMEQDLTEVGALALERRMIRWYGRKDLRTGVLENRTDGGEGTSGYRKSDVSVKQAIETKRLSGKLKLSPATIKKRQRSKTGYRWWNNGKQSMQAPKPPNETWIPGSLSSGKHWFTNHVEEILSTTCPDGWTSGRISVSDEIKKRSVDAKRKNGSYITTKESNNKRRLSQKGRPRSDEFKEKISGYLWWNNGSTEIKSKIHPGDTWIKGRLLRSK